MARHTLAASVETVHWGFLDARLPPTLTVDPGDEVEIETLSGNPQDLPPEGSGLTVPPALRDIHARSERMLPGHTLTGPVAVRGAEPGDVLEIRIRDIALGTDWGWTMHRPLSGALPDDFPEEVRRVIPLDRARNVGKLPWGDEIPLAPFLGVMGLAPPPAWGRVSSLVPRAFGGNLDLKELVAGTTLFLPVHVPGGNLSIGDGHGVQGDGEVCVTAIETSLTATLELHLHKPPHPLPAMRAETPETHVTIGLHPDLDRAAEAALRDMIALIVELSPLTRDDAYTLCSLAADMRITQMVNGTRGVHCVLPKARLAFAGG